MRKQLIYAGLLIALDQLIKVIISNFAIDKHVILIPGVLRFEPFQNTHLNWFASMVNIVMPILLMVIFQLAIATGIVLFYKYQIYKTAKTNPWLTIGFCMVIAGVCCSFVDVIIWGGSLDYIGIFNWFIFDLKDVFLNVGWISIVIWYSSKEYKDNNNKRESFKSWIFKNWAIIKRRA